MPKLHFHERDHRNLVQRIRDAETDEEIKELLGVGQTYDHASEKTRSRWHEAAKKRRTEIGHSADTAE